MRRAPVRLSHLGDNTVKLHLFNTASGSPSPAKAAVRSFLGLALAVAGVALTLAPRPAHADLRFYNNSDKPIYVSYTRFAGTAWGQNFWKSNGWYRLESGETRTVYTGSVSDVNRYWYCYAESVGKSEI